MAGAADHPTTKLSSMIRDPFVRAAFEAVERDGLSPAAAVIDRPPALVGGAAAEIEREPEPA
jgi:hypothetical protein